MSRVLVIGCGGVASVAIRKCCQVSEVFTELCIASRTKEKCDALVEKLQGTTSTTACYRCVFPDASATEGEMSCAIAGVMGPVVGMLGCLQATEAVKYLTGAGTLLTDRLLIADTLTMQFHTISVARDPHCICSHHSQPH